MWLEVNYKPITLFSLKISTASNSAGKSLPCPSPYSVKMALLNAIITYDSLETVTQNFTFIRDLQIAFKLPKAIVVNNCLVKILKDNDKVKKKIKTIEPFKKTIAFREYVYLNDFISIAFFLNEKRNSILEKKINFLEKWLMHINYFGKRGCFFQFLSTNKLENLPKGYSQILDSSSANGIIFPMDDVEMSNNVKFENMSNYSKDKAKRVSKLYVFSLRQVSSTPKYTFFEEMSF